MEEVFLITCGRACQIDFLVQKVAGSSPAQVHLFLLPQKYSFIQTNQARLGLVALDLNNRYV